MEEEEELLCCEEFEPEEVILEERIEPEPEEVILLEQIEFEPEIGPESPVGVEPVVPLGPLLKTLECQVCLEVVKLPFKVCQNGHLICEDCMKTLPNCPTCKAKFALTNPVCVKYFLEVLLPYRHVECKMPNCKEKTPLCKFEQHWRDMHPTQPIATNQGFDLRLAGFRDAQRYNVPIYLENTLFWLNITKCTGDHRELKFSVVVIGKLTKEYLIKLSFLKNDIGHLVTLKASENTNTEVQEQDEKGICSTKIDDNTIKHFINLKGELVVSCHFTSRTKEKRILLCFSAYSNLRKLFAPVRRADSPSLAIFNGVRVLAISWIVLGHRFEQSLQVPNHALVNIERYTTAWFMSPILNMMLAVELFFLLSGCLLTYNFLQSKDRGEKFSLFYFYYKRYIRLTPVLAALILLEGCLMLHSSDGPLWKRLVGHRALSCQDYWWSSLLYISNYLNPYRTCVLQSWYLSADMQLYVLSPLLLSPLAKSPKRGLMLLAACYVATTTAAFANAYYLELPAGATVTLEKKTERNHGFEYVKTHLRAASWLTGVALGYILFQHKNQPIIISKRASAWWWLLSMTLCVASVYSISPFQSLGHNYWPLVDSLHIAIHRNIFSLGASVMILLCVCGRGGFIKDFLSWRGFQPLATLVYGVYLSHMGLQMMGLARARHPLPFDMYSLFSGTMSDLLMANLMAIVLYVFVEAPFCEIGSWLYNPGKVSKEDFKTSKPPTTHEKTIDEKSVV